MKLAAEISVNVAQATTVAGAAQAKYAHQIGVTARRI